MITKVQLFILLRIVYFYREEHSVRNHCTGRVTSYPNPRKANHYKNKKNVIPLIEKEDASWDYISC